MVKIKLLTLWMIDKKIDAKKPYDDIISCGIWETRSVFNEGNKKIYELVCVMPMHEDLKIGDTRKMPEGVILALCHQVKIIHLPKIL